MKACERLNPPPPSARNRLAAPLLLFILGMMFPFISCGQVTPRRGMLHLPDCTYCWRFYPFGLRNAGLTFACTQANAVQTTVKSFSSAPASSPAGDLPDRKSTRLNSSHQKISYAVFCLK